MGRQVPVVDLWGERVPDDVGVACCRTRMSLRDAPTDAS